MENIILTGLNSKFQLKLTAAIDTNPVDYVVSYDESNDTPAGQANYGPRDRDTVTGHLTTNNLTDVVTVDKPNTTKEIKSMFVANTDVIDHTITLYYATDSDSFVLWSGPLLAGETLTLGGLIGYAILI